MKTAKFRGKRYKVVFKHLGDKCGWCDSPDTPGRRIEIDSRLDGKELLYTLTHEAVHACIWDLDEEAVEEIAQDISNFLWNLGYRKNEEESVAH